MKRACATALAGALLAFAGCGDEAPPTPRTPTATPPDFIGLVSEDVFAGDARYRRATIPRQQAAGVQLMRQTFDWSKIETAPGRYELSYYDDYVAALARQRVEVLPILFGPPRFRSSAPARGARRGTYPPKEPRAMGRLGAELARRYGPRGTLWSERPDLPRTPITSWQVWNEPSLPVYWPSGPDPAEYAELLEATAEGIHSVDRRAEIVSAGLAESRLGMPFAEFVKGMYDAGAGDAIDTFAIHPYAEDAAAAIAAVRSARSLIRDAGDAAPIWITELGWASGGPASPFTVGERRQAEYIESVFAELRRRRRELGVRGVVYFNWKDSSPFAGGGDFFGLHTGLLRRDGSPKPALEAFQSGATGKGGR